MLISAVAECLWEVAEVLPARAELLGIEAEVVVAYPSTFSKMNRA